MTKSTLMLTLISIMISTSAFSAQQLGLLNGQTLEKATVNDILQNIKPGTILLLGENHAVQAHRDQHIEILQALRTQGFKVSVGLEFINYTDQSFVSQYRLGQLNETDFLKAINWGQGFSFDFYRDQLIFPNLNFGEYSLGLNMPRAVISKISKGGLAALSAEDQKLMPPNFGVGRDSYKARFMQAAGGHCKNPENCFLSQCTWDDTMAWQAVKFVEEHPDQVLVVVVGEFHVQYGGGIKYRVAQRNAQVPVVTLSQIWAEDMTDDEIKRELQISEVEGPRADFIWVSGK